MNGNFEELTRPQIGEDGVARLTFASQTAIWSVNGGYIAAALLRAAGLFAQLSRPANITVNYIRPVQPGAVVITCAVVKRTSGSGLFNLELMQDDKLAVQASLWALSEGSGPEIQDATMPLAPHPDELRAPQELRDPALGPINPFFDVFDQRSINDKDYGQRRHRPPRYLRWLRYRDISAENSPFLAAAKTLPMIDMMGVPAASNAHGENIMTTVMPTIQLSAQFYDLAGEEDWLLGDAYAESVSGGVLGARVKIWGQDGRLIAQGMTQMISRPGGGLYVKPDVKVEAVDV